MKTAQLYTKKFDGSRDNFNPIVDEADVLPTQSYETTGKFLMSAGARSIWQQVMPQQNPSTNNKFLKSTGTAGLEVWTDVTVPTKVSDLVNDTGFITAADDITGNAATATNAITAVTATTANKVANSISFTDASGVVATFDGSASLDLSDGVRFATNSTNAVNADNATKATNDYLGQQIDSTYIKGLSIDGRTITYTKGDDTTGSFDTQDISGKANTSGRYSGLDVGSSDKLNGYNQGTRMESANLPTSTNGVGSMFNFVATSTMTVGKPPTDCQILQMNWDNSGGYDSQLAVGNSTGDIYARGQSAGSWGSWKTFYNDGNLNSAWCASAAGTSSTASSLRPAVIVTNYKNGDSWYRKWSDGWIEQGGSLAWNGAWTTLTLVTAFTTTSYFIVGGGYRTDSSPYQCMIDWRNWGTSSVSVWSSDDSTSNACSMRWYACGY